MVLLISEKTDHSTCEVIDWLAYYSVPYFRINIESPLLIDRINIRNGESGIVLKQNKSILNLDNVTSIWYRRGGITLSYKVPRYRRENSFQRRITRFCNHEILEIIEFLYYSLRQKPSIGTVNYHHLNKLVGLKKASDAGLLIPVSDIITRKDVIDLETPKITKGIRNAPDFTFPTGMALGYTTKLTKENLEPISNRIFPSIVQTKIQKLFDVRVFYLEGSCFSMAIFSQNDPKTRTDFRNYNYSNPNRVSPFKLPRTIEKKVNKLMKSIKLNCGSIDLVMSTEKKFYFLEVNPVGQFGMVSKPCNYNLEEKIALTLIRYDNKKKVSGR